MGRERDLTVGTTELTLVEQEENRVVLTIINTHTTAIIRITKNSGESAKGTPIFSESGVSLLLVEGHETRAKYYVVSDTASTVVNISEEFDAELVKRLKEISVRSIPFRQFMYSSKPFWRG